MAHANGVAQSTRLLSGWGLKFFDYDNDGHLDLMLANGHPDDMIEHYSTQVTYKEPLLLFHNEGGRLKDGQRRQWPMFKKQFAARGLAVDDFDNDGRLDVLINTNGDAPLLLHNRAGQGNHSIGPVAAGAPPANRDAIGARVSWSMAGGTRRLKGRGGSYLSAPRIPSRHPGLGAATAVECDRHRLARPEHARRPPDQRDDWTAYHR